MPLFFCIRTLTYTMCAVILYKSAWVWNYATGLMQYDVLKLFCRYSESPAPGCIPP